MSVKLQNRRRECVMGGIGIGALLLLAIILAACSGGGSDLVNDVATQAPANRTATAQAGRAAPTGAAVINTPAPARGAQPCPAAVSDPTHWDPIIPTQPGTSKVEAVICASLTGGAALQALVTVRHTVTAATLDVYVYDNILAANPTQLFSLQGLYDGDARISGYNTIITAEVDPNSPVNKNQPPSAYQRDLFREFAWAPGAGTFAQVAFPGIFPDLTRYQAEADQQQVSQGRDQWKLNAVQTAQMFAQQMLQWPASSPAALVSTSSNGESASVSVQGPGPGSNSSIIVNMSHLEQNISNGIWIVTGVTSPAMTISAPTDNDPQNVIPQVSSPVAVQGTGNAFEGVVGQVQVLDHTLTAIGQGQARVTGTNGMGNAPYAADVSYTPDMPGVVQEGVVALYAYSNANGSIASVVMVKVLLS